MYPIKNLAVAWASAADWQLSAWKQYVDNCRLAASAWETIFYRSLMISDAFQGKLPFFHPEFIRMATEKAKAFQEGGAAFSGPMRKTAGANARRLRRQMQKKLTSSSLGA